MPFAAYNSSGVRLLCGALADSLEYVRKATGRELSESEISDVRKTLAHRLTMDTIPASAIPMRSSAPLFERFSRRTPCIERLFVSFV